MKRLRLTQEKIAFIDDDLFEAINHLRWQSYRTGKAWYARRGIVVDGKVKFIALHHVAIGKPLHGLEVDHIDGNGLNNQRLNLRIVDHRTNCQNRKERRLGMTSSQYCGVSWHKQRKKWGVRIYIDGTFKHIGLFVDEKDAATAYQRAIQCQP